MVGRSKIQPPKGRLGYVSRAVIVQELSNYLDSKDEPLASNKARTAISDFKKLLAKNGQLDLILNNGEAGMELYPTQELGEWLYNKRKPYKGFTSPACPFEMPVIVNNEGMGLKISIGQVVATGASNYDELLEEMRILTATLIERDSQLHYANQVIQKYELQRQKRSATNTKNAQKKRHRYW
jgi:hypothetical protein